VRRHRIHRHTKRIHKRFKRIAKREKILVIKYIRLAKIYERKRGRKYRIIAKRYKRLAKIHHRKYIIFTKKMKNCFKIKKKIKN